jgi:hypothetical protein
MHSGQRANVVHGKHVTWLDHRERDRRGRGVYRQDVVPTAERRWHKRHRSPIDRILGQFDEREAGDLGLCGRNLRRSDESALYQVANDDFIAFIA